MTVFLHILLILAGFVVGYITRCFMDVGGCEECHLESIRKLKSKHVVEMPFLPGDDLYWIDAETMEIKLQPHGIEAVVYYGNGNFKIVDDGAIEDVGGQWTLLSREDAERYLREKLKKE